MQCKGPSHGLQCDGPLHFVGVLVLIYENEEMRKIGTSHTKITCKCYASKKYVSLKDIKKEMSI